MASVLQIGDRTISNEEMFALLQQYGMLPQLVREIIIEDAIANINLSPEEKNQAYQQFSQGNQITSEADLAAWLQARNLSQEHLDYQITRNCKLEQFKQNTWGKQLESYFIQRKSKLDKAIYSLIRVNDIGIAQELYFRIQEGEQSFDAIAREYSQGQEANTGGLMGPVELSVPHPALANLLTSNPPGKLLPPARVGEWIVIVRLEKFLPAQLDEPMKQRLLNELLDNWLQTQLKEVFAQKTSA
jgi:parvulin-like peptidyl-prolyl isomerase